ncbi:50S ribosomal protein L4 [bacterium]|nr:50S ribosomal protein L4 [bacterium]
MSPRAKKSAESGLAVDVFNVNGEKSEKKNLPEAVFNATAHPTLIAQAARYYRNRKRAGTASVKTRAAVRGSGKKIYAQKHMGRARHSDRQAPQFVGGGRAHGPTPHRASIHFPHRQRRLALRAVLSDKLRDGKLFLISLKKMETPSAKAFRGLTHRIGATEGSSLFVFEPEATSAWLSVRNLPNTSGTRALSLTAYDVLRARNLVLTDKAADILASRLTEAARG